MWQSVAGNPGSLACIALPFRHAGGIPPIACTGRGRKGIGHLRVEDLFEVFDGIPSLEKIGGDELTMALSCMLFCTHQAEGGRKLSKGLSQYVSGMIP
jgi:hypothetical protein